MKVLVSLAVASSVRERENAIANAIAATMAATAATVTSTCPDTTEFAATDPPRLAVLLEGLPDGQGQLETLLSHHAIPVIRIATGCLCCGGNVVLRVNINRLLRHQPHRLFIGIATTAHQAQLRSLLQHPPYDAWLNPGPDLVTQD